VIQIADLIRYCKRASAAGRPARMTIPPELGDEVARALSIGIAPDELIEEFQAQNRVMQDQGADMVRASIHMLNARGVKTHASTKFQLASLLREGAMDAPTNCPVTVSMSADMANAVAALIEREAEG